MNLHKNLETQPLIGEGRGILLLDDENEFMVRQFKQSEMNNTFGNRQAYRNWVLTHAAATQFVDSVCIDPEVLTEDKEATEKTLSILDKGGIGIVVNSTIEVSNWHSLGANASRMSSIFTLRDGLLSAERLAESIDRQADHATTCSDNGLAIVMDLAVSRSGAHSERLSADAHSIILEAHIRTLISRGIDMASVILRLSMVTPGINSVERLSKERTGKSNADLVFCSTPTDIGALTFSGKNLGSVEATDCLDRTNRSLNKHLPYDFDPKTSSYVVDSNANPRYASFAFGSSIIAPAVTALFQAKKLEAVDILQEGLEQVHLASFGQWKIENDHRKSKKR